MEGQLTIYQWNGFFAYSLGSTSSAIGLEGEAYKSSRSYIVKEGAVSISRFAHLTDGSSD